MSMGLSVGAVRRGVRGGGVAQYGSQYLSVSTLSMDIRMHWIGYVKRDAAVHRATVTPVIRPTRRRMRILLPVTPKQLQIKSRN